MTVYVHFEGGLGNQLFQYAAGASIAGVGKVKVLETRPAPQLALTSLVPGLAREVTARDRWRLGVPYADDATGWRGYIQRSLATARARVARRTVRPGGALEHAFDPRPSEPAKPLVLDGYFQHPDWYEPALPSLLTSVRRAAPDGWTPNTGTVVHVRGGDYVTLGWQLELDYYERALATLGTPSRLCVVADDVRSALPIAALCRSKGWECDDPVPSASAIDDFWTVAAAARVIMSNSTFCWWAVMVGEECRGSGRRRRDVVMPDAWVTGKGGVLAQPGWQRV